MEKFIEPMLIKAGDARVQLGFMRQPPKVDCRVISEDQYQLLYKAFLKLNENTVNEANRVLRCRRCGSEIRSDIDGYCAECWSNR